MVAVEKIVERAEETFIAIPDAKKKCHGSMIRRSIIRRSIIIVFFVEVGTRSSGDARSAVLATTVKHTRRLGWKSIMIGRGNVNLLIVNASLGNMGHRDDVIQRLVIRAGGEMNKVRGRGITLNVPCVKTSHGNVGKLSNMFQRRMKL